MAFRHALLAAAALVAAAPAHAGSFTQSNLTSDGYIVTPNTDANLKNPWGISFSPTGPFWVSDNNSGLTTLYNTAGAPQSLVVTIPPVNGNPIGSPTGQVFNPGTGFVVTEGANSGPAAFLFDTEDGTISGWNPSVDAANAVIAVNDSANGAVFKGLALYTDAKGATYLLAADLFNGVVDVFDTNFKLVRSFRDKNLEAVYAPHNVAVLNGNIYVAYAWVNHDRNDVVPHQHWGVVEQVDISGHIVHKRKGGVLNAPWGLAIAPKGFGRFAGDLLVGNFGDGRITAYTTDTLMEKGQLMSAPKTPIAISGLWGLIVGNGGSGGSASDVYFTAGPNNEADGLFGSLSYAKAH
jgi:uncharacterized protein (TIGR03118 family)